MFTFVMEGAMTLHGEGQGAHELTAGDAYVIPPHLKTSHTDCSEDLELLEVSLPAEFETTVHANECLS
jgi:quercetin dioxygenase-like cupin family protein